MQPLGSLGAEEMDPDDFLDVLCIALEASEDLEDEEGSLGRVCSPPSWAPFACLRWEVAPALRRALVASMLCELPEGCLLPCVACRALP